MIDRERELNMQRRGFAAQQQQQQSVPLTNYSRGSGNTSAASFGIAQTSSSASIMTQQQQSLLRHSPPTVSGEGVKYNQGTSRIVEKSDN